MHGVLTAAVHYAYCATMLTGAEVRTLRVALNETRVKFAARFGVNVSTVSRWETRGAPKGGTARLMLAKLWSRLPKQATEDQCRSNTGTVA